MGSTALLVCLTHTLTHTKVLEAWYFHQGCIIVVLEAQFHTRAVGTDVVHVEMTTAARGDDS